MGQTSPQVPEPDPGLVPEDPEPEPLVVAHGKQHCWPIGQIWPLHETPLPRQVEELPMHPLLQQTLASDGHWLSHLAQCLGFVVVSTQPDLPQQVRLPAQAARPSHLQRPRMQALPLVHGGLHAVGTQLPC